LDSIELSDGRRLDVRVTGPEEGPVLVFHHGTPGSASGYRIVEDPAHERGLRMVWISRPGYGDSTRQPGRRVVDIVSDTAEVLEALGVDSCLVGGGSSGGPHALACATRLDTVQAALVVSSHAPFEAEGLNYLAGMGEDNFAVYGAALHGEETLRKHLEAQRDELLEITVEGLLEAWASLLPEVDQVALSEEFGEDAVADVEEAIRTGVDGWVDDMLAFTKQWGFELDEINKPTLIWHSSEDRFNPIAHGHWLADNVPASSSHLLQGEGHLSTWQATPTMLDQLLAAAQD
jgi:pimeloyl-ACP methyl ester carboxylesterase